MSDLGFERGTVAPRYGSDCLSSVPATVLSLLGIQSGGPRLPDDAFEGVDTTGIEKVVLFVLDGLGHREWRRQEGRGGFVRMMARRGRVTPITSVFPSTTSTALTTLATGLTPQEHGLIEWYMYLSEIDATIETLPFSPMGSREGDLLRPSLDPRVLFDGESIYGRMVRQGVEVHSFLSRRIARSGYSSVVHAGTDVVPYSHASDLLTSLRRRIEGGGGGGGGGPAFFYVYWPMVDTVEHVYGPNTEEADLEASSLSHTLAEGLVGRVERSSMGKTLFLLTADHGQILSPTRDALMLDAYVRLRGSLAVSANGRTILPWGGTRDVYLQVRDEALAETAAYLSEELRGRARVLLTADAVGSGLFGTGAPSKRFASRVGNLMVLPERTGSAWYRHPGADLGEIMGVHGGLHEDEMMVPFAVVRGSALGT